jgi:DHHC palmitoyltransferase
MVAPGETEHFENKNCEKCKDKATWKPARAHHCRECGHCIFKVRLDLYLLL